MVYCVLKILGYEKNYCIMISRSCINEMRLYGYNND